MLRALLPTIALLFVYATAAIADCAWVLWRNDVQTIALGKIKDGTFVPNPGESYPQQWWEVETVASKDAECAAAQRAKTAAYTEFAKKSGHYYEVLTNGENELTAIQWKRRGQPVRTVEEGDEVARTVSRTTLKCLPDTVDPRGPKGGAR